MSLRKFLFFLLSGWWILSNTLSALIDMAMWCFLFATTNLVCFFDFWILSQPYSPGINPTWSRCFILFIHCWIQFDNILLRNFVPVFLKDFGLWFSLLYCLVFFLFFNLLFSVLFKLDDFYWSIPISSVIYIVPLSSSSEYFILVVFFSTKISVWVFFIPSISLLMFPVFPFIHPYFLSRVIISD